MKTKIHIRNGRQRNDTTIQEKKTLNLPEDPLLCPPTNDKISKNFPKWLVYRLLLLQPSYCQSLFSRYELFLRTIFSAHNFWSDAFRYELTMQRIGIMLSMNYENFSLMIERTYPRRRSESANRLLRNACMHLEPTISFSMLLWPVYKTLLPSPFHLPLSATYSTRLLIE